MNRPHGGGRRYPWRSLLVGESFLSPVRACNLSKTRKDAERATGRRFRTSTVQGGTRVWRTA